VEGGARKKLGEGRQGRDALGKKHERGWGTDQCRGVKGGSTPAWIGWEAGGKKSRREGNETSFGLAGKER